MPRAGRGGGGLGPKSEEGLKRARLGWKIGLSVFWGDGRGAMGRFAEDSCARRWLCRSRTFHPVVWDGRGALRARARARAKAKVRARRGSLDVQRSDGD